MNALPNAHPTGPAAVVPEELRGELAQARDEALALHPVVERILAVYQRAETLALEAFPIPSAGTLADDLAFDRCLAQAGAYEVTAALRKLSELADPWK